MRLWFQKTHITNIENNEHKKPHKPTFKKRKKWKIGRFLKQSLLGF